MKNVAQGAKLLANIIKALLAVEMGVFFILFPEKSPWDIAQIAFFQYSLFFVVDAALLIRTIIKALKGE